LTKDQKCADPISGDLSNQKGGVLRSSSSPILLFSFSKNRIVISCKTTKTTTNEKITAIIINKSIFISPLVL
jgi:hypothetical protein